MLASVRTAAVFGIDAVAVHVEVDVSFGLPIFTMVGLPDTSVRESRDRVRAAIRNCGFEFPSERVTVNLAPADVRKAGAAFDLPIALGVLAASGVVECRAIADVVLLGELSLDGGIHAARGVLPIAVAARAQGMTTLLLPAQNAAEAAVVGGLRIWPVASLSEAVGVLNDPSTARQHPATASVAPTAPAQPDLCEVRGQAMARRALEIAAAGAPSSPPHRTSRRREDDAGAANPGSSSGVHLRGVARVERDPFSGRYPPAGGRAARRAAVPRAAPHDLRCRARRRRHDPPSR